MKYPARLLIALTLVGPLMLTVTSAGVSAELSKDSASRVVGLNFNEPKQTQFLKAVLKSMNLHYTVTATLEGELVEWASMDTAQELEIQNRVSQFWFISTQCSGMRPPLPTQPARAKLSC